MLPIVPFNQYLSVGIVINRHNGILFQTGAKKKRRKVEESISKNLDARDSSLEENRTEKGEGIRSYVEARGTNGERRKERERKRDEDRN